jgi:hypothetical protein
VLLTTCKKYRFETNCAGYVIDFTTSEPVPGATVFLGRAVENLSGTDYLEVDQTISDSHGKFAFDFTAEKTGTYFVLAKGANWYFDNEINERVELAKGKKGSKKQQSLQVMMKPKGILKLSVKKIDTSYHYLYAEFRKHIEGLIVSGSVIDTFTIFKYSIYGNANNEIWSHIIKQDASYTTFYDEKGYNIQIYCKAKDTTYFTLNY